MSARSQRYLILMATGLAAAGCSGNGPTGPGAFDVTLSRQHLQAVSTLLGSPLWESFDALAARFGPGQPAAAAAVGLASRLLELTGGPARVPRLPASIRGTTFVLDPASGRYVPDPSRTGAPGNGIRFILYAVNPITREPVLSAEIGHADFTDEGDALPSGAVVHFVVVSGDRTFLDYVVTADGTETAGRVTAKGFVADLETRLEFDIALNSKVTGTGPEATVTFNLSIPARGFSASATVWQVNTATGGTGQVDLAIRIGADTFSFIATGAEGTIDATIRVNGEVFATVRGPADRPDIRGADGRSLSAEELEALGQIVALNGAVFRLFENLLAPVGSILAFGLP